MRGFDLIAYGLLIGLITFYVVDRGDVDAQRLAALTPVGGSGLSIIPPSDLDPEVTLRLPDEVEPGTGTAFSVGDGVWFTARHVVDGCADVGVIVAEEQGVLAQEVMLAQNADLAIVRAPLKRTGLRFKENSDELAVGARAYHIGYPQGVPGEVATRLLGREHISISGRFEAFAPILAWAETNRTRGIVGSLGGLSGGPAIADDGEVVGVVIAEAPRRGRVYTAAPSSVEMTLSRTSGAGGASAPAAGNLSVQNYSDAARALRQSLRVAKVVCVVA